METPPPVTAQLQAPSCREPSAPAQMGRRLRAISTGNVQQPFLGATACQALCSVTPFLRARGPGGLCHMHLVPLGPGRAWNLVPWGNTSGHSLWLAGPWARRGPQKLPRWAWHRGTLSGTGLPVLSLRAGSVPVTQVCVTWASPFPSLTVSPSASVDGELVCFSEGL